MATSSWTDVNPNIVQVDTKKKFFSGYLYKLVVRAPGGRLINSKSGANLDELLANRIQTLKSRYTAHWWRQNEIKVLESECFTRQLKYYHEIKQTYKGRVKARVEEPTISLYCDDESTLIAIASAAPLKHRITEIHKPASTTAADALNRGEIVVKKDPEFLYKVTLKESWTVSADLKQAISDYLYNLEDDVKVPKGLARQLSSRSRNWFPGGYFYCNDPAITTFLTLISPGCVSGIFKLTKLDE